ncbi:MarR family winged helix-turn-helix transcriptional regulator [Phytohabitans rumicis]|uniref:MarR family transcriptional regulator n=1 Tax=Phytohabitans rumicis TaxID=1076125 RepID=A0A6V8LLA3_9ACTN|nr:MarR family transcriptional regulator [Phytohabitans rumicis]GFJ94956.1 MarR family transcriptional regulator [Phytohabitans rumicis]
MDEELLLRRQVCFALYSASRAATALYRPLLDELGLTYPQYLVLLLLWERDGRTVKELGDELDLDSGTLSPLLKRLEAAGLVTRRRFAGDERVVEIALTAAGTALRRRARKVPAALGTATGLSTAELSTLHRTLTELAGVLRTAAH